MASLREKLAIFIMEGDHTELQWLAFQKQIPSLQLKTVSHGKVLISFDGEEFEQPSIWLGNFQNRCIQRFETEKNKLSIVLPKERVAEVLGNVVDEKKDESFEDRCAHVLSQLDWSGSKGNLMETYQAILAKVTGESYQDLATSFNLVREEYHKHR